MVTHELNTIRAISRQKEKQTYLEVNIDLSLFGNFPLSTETPWAAENSFQSSKHPFLRNL